MPVQNIIKKHCCKRRSSAGGGGGAARGRSCAAAAPGAASSACGTISGELRGLVGHSCSGIAFTLRPSTGHYTRHYGCAAARNIFQLHAPPGWGAHPAFAILRANLTPQRHLRTSPRTSRKIYPEKIEYFWKLIINALKTVQKHTNEGANVSYLSIPR